MCRCSHVVCDALVKRITKERDVKCGLDVGHDLELAHCCLCKGAGAGVEGVELFSWSNVYGGTVAQGVDRDMEICRMEGESTLCGVEMRVVFARSDGEYAPRVGGVATDVDGEHGVRG